MNQDVHLVEVEVNGANGSSTGAFNFAPSKTKILPSEIHMSILLSEFLRPYGNNQSQVAQKLWSSLEEKILEEKMTNPLFSKFTNQDYGEKIHWFAANWLEEKGAFKIRYYAKKQYFHYEEVQPAKKNSLPNVKRTYYGSEFLRTVTFDYNSVKTSDTSTTDVYVLEPRVRPWP